MATNSFYSHIVPLFFFFFLYFPYSANSLQFQISHFHPSSPHLQYYGDALSSVGCVELNKVNYLNRVGWVTFTEKVALWNCKTGETADFTTHFSFRIDTRGFHKHGHGLAFFLAPQDLEIPPNSAGGFLGLFNTTTDRSPSNQIVHVEFDTFPNPEWDPATAHVGINVNSILSAVCIPWNASLHSADTADVWITYNSKAKNLCLSWTYQTTSNPQESSSLSYGIDLKEFLPEWVKVGFSAATGMYVERHVLQSWEFNSTLAILEYSMGEKTKKISLAV